MPVTQVLWRLRPAAGWPHGPRVAGPDGRRGADLPHGARGPAHGLLHGVQRGAPFHTHGRLHHTGGEAALFFVLDHSHDPSAFPIRLKGLLESYCCATKPS